MEEPKHGVIRDSGPLPEEALRTLAWINDKDKIIVELQHEIRELRHEVANWKAKYQNAKFLQKREEERGGTRG